MKGMSLFFAPLDEFEPAGMFTPDHLIGLVISFGLLGVMLVVSRKMTWQMVMKLTRWLALIVTGLELIKIAYNFYYGYTWLDAWFPLSYCSLFIYALWLSGYGKGRIKGIGDAYLVLGCLLGGLGFLLVPTTSLMRYPIWHYLSLYSLFFHVMMIYVAVLYLWHQQILINLKTYGSFSLYLIVAAMISIAINTVYGANIMLLREPYNIPLPWIHTLQANSQAAYTLLASLLYLVGPALFALLTNKWLHKKASTQ